MSSPKKKSLTITFKIPVVTLTDIAQYIQRGKTYAEVKYCTVNMNQSYLL